MRVDRRARGPSGGGARAGSSAARSASSGGGMEIRGDRLPLRFKRQNVSSYNRPEIFGESNHKVLKDWLGLSQSEVERLEHIGTVK